jgi:hypothetical protein
MSTASRRDVLNAFPDIEDHAVVEILDLQASVDDLEAALGLLMSDGEDLIAIRSREGDRIHRLMNILSRAGVRPGVDRDR